VARFRFGGVLGLTVENFRIDDDAEVGASCEWDLLVEDEMWSLENPRTILVVLTSVEVLSLFVSREVMSEYSLPTAVATVEVEESGMICDWSDDGVGVGSSHADPGSWVGPARGAGVAGVGGSVGGCTVKDAGSGGSGESGSRVFFCWMDMTIFSRSNGEMCFSFLPESSLRNSGRADVGQEWVARSRLLLDESEEPKLDERSGTSSDGGLLRLDAGGYDDGNVVFWSGARQQKLSWLKMRQLMFS
jgi:hypothetical protein